MKKVYVVLSEGGMEGVFTTRNLAEGLAKREQERSRVFLNNGNCYDFWVIEEVLDEK